MEGQKVQIVHLQMVKDAEITYGKQTVDSPKEAAGLFRDFLGGVDRECLVVCSTDTKMKPAHIQVVSIGASNYCPASIPGIFKAALLSNSVNILLAHNHPSGDCTPSKEDILLTGRVLEAGKLLGISLIDHIILGEGGSFYSFRESGRFLGLEGID